MSRPKAKREIATKNIRVYQSSLEKLQYYAAKQKRTIASTLDGAIGLAVMFGKWDV